jgi:hypothetical protein
MKITRNEILSAKQFFGQIVICKIRGAVELLGYYDGFGAPDIPAYSDKITDRFSAHYPYVIRYQVKNRDGGYAMLRSVTDCFYVLECSSCGQPLINGKCAIGCDGIKSILNAGTCPISEDLPMRGTSDRGNS